MNHSRKKPLPRPAKVAVTTEAPRFPMRINKYLAWKKHSTRRGADELIAQGKVFLNGKKAVLGDRVTERDTVDVRFRGPKKEYVYYAYNKPRGVVTHSPQHGEADVRKNAQLPKDVFPVGRLDKDSHGLLILTNDGRITDRMLNPRFDHEKEYVVKTKQKLRSSFKVKMEAGVRIEDGTTKPCTVDIINDRTFRVVLTEGKKHQIRRMCVALFQDVDDLQRVRVMNITLGDIPEGSYRKLEGKELETFLKEIGL